MIDLSFACGIIFKLHKLPTEMYNEYLMNVITGYESNANEDLHPDLNNNGQPSNELFEKIIILNYVTESYKQIDDNKNHNDKIFKLEERLNKLIDLYCENRKE